MKTMSEILKAALQSLPSLIAFIVLYAGLNVGLPISATFGTILWLLASIIALATLYWVIKEGLDLLQKESDLSWAEIARRLETYPYTVRR